MQDINCFMYDKVPHDPLNYLEAKRCLREFMRCVSIALNEFHANGWTHQDVRLPNICFSSSFQPVFIDVDRMRGARLRHTVDEDSCMYFPSLNNNGHGSLKNDWRQLGWLIAWVLDPVPDYHGRKFETLPDDIKRDGFLKKLIKEGTGPSSCLTTYM